jgi:hypothetical protein
MVISSSWIRDVRPIDSTPSPNVPNHSPTESISHEDSSSIQQTKRPYQASTSYLLPSISYTSCFYLPYQYDAFSHLIGSISRPARNPRPISHLQAQ